MTTGARLLRGIDHRTVPWKNGAGTTVEIAVHPTPGTVPVGPGGFDWRASIAVISGAAPFSQFPGVDRFLMALSAPGLALLDSGRPVRLPQYAVHAFAGENSVESVLVSAAIPPGVPAHDSPPTSTSAPTLDLNLMVRRDRYTGALRMVRVVDAWSAQPAAASDGTVIVVVLSGGLSWGDRMLAEHDTVICPTTHLLSITGTGILAVATVLPR